MLCRVCPSVLVIIGSSANTVGDGHSKTESNVCFRSLSAVVNVYYLACLGCYSNCFYVLYSNKIAPLMDLLLHQLTVGLLDMLRVFPQNLDLLFYSEEPSLPLLS